MTIESIVKVAAGAVALLGGIVSLVRRIRQKETSELPVSVESPGLARVIRRQLPLDLELLPLDFDISLASRIPQVEVRLRAVNYLRKSLDLESMTVTLHLTACPSFEHLTLVRRLELWPGRSREVCCRCPLVDSEINLVRACMVGEGPFHGTVQIEAQGRAGRKIVRYQTPAATHVRGWIAKLDGPPASS